MKSLLVLCLLIALASAATRRFTIDNYSKAQGPIDTTAWFSDFRDFHYKVHSANRVNVDETELSFRLEVGASRFDHVVEGKSIYGNFSVVNILNGSKRTRPFKFYPKRHQQVSKWFPVMTRKEIMEPTKGWYDFNKDQVTAEIDIEAI